MGYRAAPSTFIRRWLLRRAGSLYATMFIVIAGAALTVPAFYLWSQNANALLWIVGIALTVTPATILSATIVNWPFD